MEYYCRLVSQDSMLTVDFPDVPNAISYGNSREEALHNAAEALNGVLESDVGRGFPLPEFSTGPGDGLYPVEVASHIVVAWEIRKLRGDKSQSEIASRLGLTYQAYQRLENPAKGNPTIKTLERLAHALGKRLEVHIA